LGDELDVADGPLAQLDLAPVTSLLAQIGLGALLHRIRVGARLFRISYVEHQRLDPAQELIANRLVAGDHARFEQRLLFPLARVLFQVSDVAIERRDQRADPSPGAQPHVHPVEKTFGGRARQALDQPLAQPPIVVRPGRGDEHQVDVGAIVQLLPAQLAHRDHGKAVRRCLRLFGGDFEARAHEAVG
jgi:hypothetical protein